MMTVCWAYVILTLFEPTHIDDVSMKRWDTTFTGLFCSELCILLMFFFDIVASYAHNYFECVFKETKLSNSEVLIAEEKRDEFDPNAPHKSRNRRETIVENTVMNSSSKKKEEQKEKLNKEKETLASKQRKLLQKTGFWIYFKVFFETFLHNLLFYKLVMLILFATDFSLFFNTYPHQSFRFGRFFRTIPFVIYSKSTMRTLQAVFHSVKRIFDYLVFFFSIVLLWALLGLKIFADDNRTYYIDPSYDPYINDYNDYGVIVNALVVLVTFDNYPKVMQPLTNISWWYLLYFMPYIMLNILFFKPVPIAVVYDGFRVVGVHPGKEEQAGDRGSPHGEGGALHLFSVLDQRRVVSRHQVCESQLFGPRAAAQPHLPEPLVARADQGDLQADRRERERQVRRRELLEHQ